MYLAPKEYPTEDVLVFDIEANDLWYGVTVTHCIVLIDPHTKEKYKYPPDRIKEGLERMSKAKVLVGHNVLDYDLPALFKLYGFTFNGTVFDTLVASRLLNPDLPGGHSLKAWGKRLGLLKIDFIGDEEVEDAFAVYTEEMLTYCVRDVEVNVILFLKLAKEIYGVNDG